MAVVSIEACPRNLCTTVNGLSQKVDGIGMFTGFCDVPLESTPLCDTFQFCSTKRAFGQEEGSIWRCMGMDIGTTLGKEG